ncbi:MAG: hypothetical protein EA412_14520 [Chitinophagaceae bacterium]|nr:MAG: hypothetical protein EA412_14520 [Chitinophagaceae bacterium]
MNVTSFYKWIFACFLITFVTACSGSREVAERKPIDRSIDAAIAYMNENNTEFDNYFHYSIYQLLVKEFDVKDAKLISDRRVYDVYPHTQEMHLQIYEHTYKDRKKVEGLSREMAKQVLGNLQKESIDSFYVWSIYCKEYETTPLFRELLDYHFFENETPTALFLAFILNNIQANKCIELNDADLTKYRSRLHEILTSDMNLNPLALEYLSFLNYVNLAMLKYSGECDAFDEAVFNKVFEFQNEDGGWPYPDTEFSSNTPTMFALWTLLHHRKYCMNN